MTLVLAARGIRKSFSGNKALNDVAFTLRAGEIHSLMGENGAGKSALIKVLSGVYSMDAGTIELSGEAVVPKSNHHAQKLGISTVFQEINLIPTLSVAENIFLGREPKRFGRILYGEMQIGAVNALKRLELDLDVTRALEDYPIAIQQMVAIARALDLEAKVLILDEATSSLDRDEVVRLFTVLKKLKSQGLAIVFVSHFLDQIYEICDRITILRNGSLVGEWAIGDLSRTELVSKMMGRDLASDDQAAGLPAAAQKSPWLTCDALARTGAIESFNLDVRAGETLGLAGLLGSGRTEIIRLLFGIDQADQGTIAVDGRAVDMNDPKKAIQAGFALVPEDRKHQSIFPGLSVRENIVLALQVNRSFARSLPRQEQNEIADRFIKAMGIRTADAEQAIETLSGGNQQKAILARWLALEPRLLLLDEPTRGIDVGAKAEILKLIRELSSQGQSVVFVSSELEEVVRVSDRVAVLKDHRKIAEIGRSQLTEASVMTAIGEAP